MALFGHSGSAGAAVDALFGNLDGHTVFPFYFWGFVTGNKIKQNFFPSKFCKNQTLSLQAIEHLGAWFRQTAGNPGIGQSWERRSKPGCERLSRIPGSAGNRWLRLFQAWGQCLQPDAIQRWLNAYPALRQSRSSKVIGVINAGNIPLVGLHDLLTVLITGHSYIGKNASDDSFLYPGWPRS